MHQKMTHHTHPDHPGSIVNRTFEHKPEFPGNPYLPPINGHHHPFPPPNPKTWAYYGNWESYRAFVDTNQFTAAAPGVSSGLYNPAGPLNLGNSQYMPTCLTEVRTECQFNLAVTFKYSDERFNETVMLSVGKIYNVVYLEDGNLKKCTGKCTDIWKIYGSNDQTSYYKIKFDCSVNYSNQTVVIKNDQIRALSVYTGYEGQSTDIDNSVHKFGTTVGTIKNAIITNATLDSNGNIIEGDMVNGELEGYTLDGIAMGYNNTNKYITTINSRTKDGRIIGGKIISGLSRSGQVDGHVEEDTNITTHATVRGVVTNVIIINSVVEKGVTKGGKIINTTIENGILYNATITGDDMITTGGITVGNVTTGGTTTGGTGTGGTMVGVIDGKVFTIEEGVTTSKSSEDKLITTGGVVVGGTIIGGVKQGNSIIGATIKGGVVTNGITVNGVTSEGVLIPTPASPVPITKPVIMNPNFSDVNPDTKFPNHVNQPLYPPEWPDTNNPHDYPNKYLDDLIIKINHSTGQVRTNFGTATMQTFPVINTPIGKPTKPKEENW